MNTIHFITPTEGPVADVDFTTLKRLRSLNAPFVFIGLGGGGTTAVSMLKQLFEETFSAHVPEHQPGISPSFQFVTFDSDSTRPSNLEPGREWFQLDGQGLGLGAWDDFRKDPHFAEWLASGVSYADFATGCQGYRNLGKFLFQKNISDIYGAIKGASDRARGNPAAEKASRITFILFCTLAGGTGSGCLLDCTFLIRAMFPDMLRMKLWGFLAAAEGFAGDPIMDARAKSGTYAALREIDFFMNGTKRESFITDLEQNSDGRDGYLGTRHGAAAGTFAFPGSTGIQGRYEKPFDWCFLLGHDNSKGILLADKSPELSAMMARHAFSLCAYPVPEAGSTIERGQSFEANANNISDHLSRPTEHGANVCYMVPGLAAAHTPAAQVFDLMTVQSALVMLESMLHGSADTQHMDEAKAFVSERKLTPEGLTEFIAQKLETLTGDSYQKAAVQSALAVLPTSKRYAKRTAILRLLSDYLEIGNFQNRITDRKKQLWRQELDPKLIVTNDEGKRDLQATPYTIQEMLGVFQQAIIDRCNEEMRTEGRRKAAVVDFLHDLAIMVDDLVRKCTDKAAASTKAHQGQCLVWEKGKSDPTGQRNILENFVTKNGSIFTDPDFLHKGAVLKDFEASSEAAFQSYRDRLRDELAVAFARELAAVVAFARKTMDAYFAACQSAQASLVRVEDELVRDLFEQEEGRGGQLHTVFSFSLMPAAWQAQFRKERNLDDLTAVQALIDSTAAEKARAAAGDPEADVSGALWRPLDVIAFQASEDANPTHKPLSDWIAHDLCEHIFAQLKPMQHDYSVWAEGQGLARTLGVALPDERPGQGFKRVGLLLQNKCAPQWDISLNPTKLGTSVRTIKILAGPPDVTAKIKEEAQLGNDVNSLLTYEADRLNMITFAYPIGLAGCSRAHSPLKAAYDQAVQQARTLDKARGVSGQSERLYHCFPRSWEWTDPTDLDAEEDAYLPEFTTALLLGRLHRLPETPAAYKTWFESYVQPALDKAASQPADKSIGLFTPDGSAWYLTPYASLDATAKREAALEPPRKLGSDMLGAFNQFAAKPELIEQCRNWTTWWKENRTSWFRVTDMQAVLETLSSWAADQRERHDPTTRDYRLWDKVRRHFDAARRGLA